ncbi:MAG: Bacterial regulatory protein luxR family [Actinomycetota bacterium]|jgi:DNA-binding CsgD family transcriptional regulator
MTDVRAASGTAENAKGFCQYLVETLFAYWRANGALIFDVNVRGEIEELGSWGWVSQPQHRAKFLDLAHSHFVKHLSTRVQALYPTLDSRGENLDIEFLAPNCAALLFVGNQPQGRPSGGVVVTFQGPLATDEIEQIRRTFPMLKASLDLFLGVDSEPAWAKEYNLSSRQVAILQQMLEGVSYRDISRALWVSESTIKQEAKRIFTELSVKNRYEAAKKLR